MKNLNREFKLREQILLLMLAAIVIGAAYYYFVHKPVTSGIADAKQKISELSAEKESLDAQIALLERMQETNQDPAAIELGYMPSYSYSEKELKLLNDVLQNTLDYTVTFSGLSRDGNQIRRNFTLVFRVNNYNEVEEVLYNLTKTELRCLIGDMSCSIVSYSTFTNFWDGGEKIAESNSVKVSVSATFYETLVEGTPDSALPAG